MLSTRRWNPWIGCLLMVSAGLVGCAPKTNVSATGNVPAQYSHVFVSVQEIWLNTSATAGPDDTTWIKFPLDTPATVDLATSVGALTSITSGLNVPVGTYAQVRLIPVDAGATLLSSATSLGAVYNSEVDYVDTTGNTVQLPLELQNPDKGIGIATSLAVKSTGTGNIFASSSSSSDSTTSTSTSSSSSTSSTPFSLAINIDGATDLVPFKYNIVSGSTTGNTNGMLLNPHMGAYDASQVGAIAGTLSIADLTGITSTSTSAFVDIQVTAESLSTDGTRHVAVNSAPVRSDGTFTLYPLASSSSSPTSYDLVIHGPAIATIIVKGVTVNVGDPSSTTPVNIGTITPRAAESFTVNLTTTTPLPAGALVGFYQTLPGTSEVPYLIEQRPIDPFSRAFSSDEALSSATLDYGTFSGSAVSLNTAGPAEGTSTYRVAASGPLFADGVLTTTVAPSGNSSTATLVAVPTLSPASGITGLATVTASVTTPTKYDQGYLIISHDGAIVATAALDSVLGQSAASTLTISGLPGGTTTTTTGALDSGLYDVSVRVWKSSDPTGLLNRETYPTALDLRSGSAAYSLRID
jgi:Domain of unknown function (DUF4382)